MAKEFKSWLCGLMERRSWTVPRSYSELQWSTLERIELHVFCDASKKAYGCAVYLRMVRGENVSTALVMSMSRVAPVKTVTLPQLELMATVLDIKG